MGLPALYAPATTSREPSAEEAMLYNPPGAVVTLLVTQVAPALVEV